MNKKDARLMSSNPYVQRLQLTQIFIKIWKKRILHLSPQDLISQFNAEIENIEVLLIKAEAEGLIEHE